MLTGYMAKIKSFLIDNRRDLFLAALVFLMSVTSFGLGRLSAIWPVKEPIVLEEPETWRAKPDDTVTAIPLPSGSVASPSGNLVASKNGSSYHRLDCVGAKQIKEENRVWFKNAEEARAAGYKPAANCPGL